MHRRWLQWQLWCWRFLSQFDHYALWRLRWQLWWWLSCPQIRMPVESWPLCIVVVVVVVVAIVMVVDLVPRIERPLLQKRLLVESWPLCIVVVVAAIVMVVDLVHGPDFYSLWWLWWQFWVIVPRFGCRFECWSDVVINCWSFLSGFLSLAQSIFSFTFSFLSWLFSFLIFFSFPCLFFSVSYFTTPTFSLFSYFLSVSLASCFSFV